MPNEDVPTIIEKMLTFVEAYDAWAQSKEHCGGPLFEAMVEARQHLEEALEEEHNGPQDNP